MKKSRISQDSIFIVQFMDITKELGKEFLIQFLIYVHLVNRTAITSKAFIRSKQALGNFPPFKETMTDRPTDLRTDIRAMMEFSLPLSA